MASKTYTNKTGAAVVLNVKGDGGKVESQRLGAGETADLDLIETPMVKARLESGALVEGSKGGAKDKAPAASK